MSVLKGIRAPKGYKLSPIFTIAKDGNPVRPGVYPIENDRGYLYYANWTGEHWSPGYSRPSTAANIDVKGSTPRRAWRGYIPLES